MEELGNWLPKADDHVISFCHGILKDNEISTFQGDFLKLVLL